MDPEKFYDSELVERVAGRLCRRYHFAVEECADFRQDVHLRLIEGNYARLQTFKGRCKVETFLRVIVQRLALDYIIRKNGKFTASAKAKRLGPAAVDLEVLMYREGQPRDQAIQIMVSRNRHGLGEEELRKLATQIPLRVFGRKHSDEATANLKDPKGADSQTLDAERTEAKQQVILKLRHAMERLEPEEHLILRMRYWDGLSIVAIDKILKLGKRPHDRVGKILEHLQSLLREAGVEVDDVRDLLME